MRKCISLLRLRLNSTNHHNILHTQGYRKGQLFYIIVIVFYNHAGATAKNVVPTKSQINRLYLHLALLRRTFLLVWVPA